MRDQVVDFVRRWSEKTEIGVGRFIAWLGVTGSKFYDWRERYGCVNEHNGWVPRDFWLEAWEKEAIIDLSSREPTLPLAPPLMKWEFPRLCRGGTRSLTVPGVCPALSYAPSA